MYFEGYNLFDTYCKMGNSGAVFPPKAWNLVTQNGGTCIYQDPHGQLAEKHLVQNDPRVSEQAQLGVYAYRAGTTFPVVKVYWAELMGSGLCSTSQNLEVYQEYIPHRLSSIWDLTHGQALYVLSESLAGFQELHQRMRAFQITDALIGFNQEGKAKVWSTPDFARNRMEHNPVILLSIENPQQFDDKLQGRQEIEMVEQVWQAVDRHSHMNPEFRASVNGMQGYNFNGARNRIASQITSGDTFVPDRLPLPDKNRVLQLSRHIPHSQH